MRVLIFGGRDWVKTGPVFALLDGLYAVNPRDLTLIHGKARGADSLVDEWLEMHFAHDNIELVAPEVLRFPAQWEDYPPELRWRAGHDRNQRMLDEGTPDVAFGFKDDFGKILGRDGMPRGGTEDMARRCAGAGVPVYITSRFRGF